VFLAVSVFALAATRGEKCQRMSRDHQFLIGRNDIKTNATIFARY
jgi:hypothetical protein